MKHALLYITRNVACTKFVVCHCIVLGLLVWAASFAPSAFANNLRDGSMFLSYQKNVQLDESYQLTQLHLTTFNIPLNAFEAELYFDPAVTQVSDVIFHETLCERRFIIDNVIDNQIGRVHVSCGSLNPFMTNGEHSPIITVRSIMVGEGMHEFTLGPKTSFHIHDGFGTRANVTML